MLSCVLLGEAGPAHRSSPVVPTILRGVLFVPAALLALVTAANVGYFGANIVLVLLMAALIPAALVCWVAASGGKAGDRWTVGYVVAWLVVMLVLPGILDLFGVLV